MSDTVAVPSRVPPLVLVHGPESVLSERAVSQVLADIKLTAPADQFENYVRIESIDGDADEHGNVPKWTKITVRDHIRDQE